MDAGREVLRQRRKKGLFLAGSPGLVCSCLSVLLSEVGPSTVHRNSASLSLLQGVVSRYPLSDIIRFAFSARSFPSAYRHA